MKLKTLLLAAITFGLASVANAAIYTDVHDGSELGPDGWADINPGNPYSNTFDLLAQGYSIGQNIASGSASFWFRDQTRNEAAIEDFQVVIDGATFVSYLGQLPFGTGLGLELSDALGINLIAILQDTGLLTYSITSNSGNFRLKQASLTVETPDAAATISLLGLGLLGIAAIRRKMA